MNTKLSMVLALALVMVFPAASIYAWQSTGGVTSEVGMATNVAMSFLRNAPTFRFDGITETMKVLETHILESYPLQYVVVIAFDSRHAGYGDRTAQVLAQVIASHVAEVKVVQNKVVSAIMDDVWDELNQRKIGGDEDMKIISPELARDLAIKYTLQAHGIEGVKAPSSWAELNLTPQGWVGLNKMQYTGDGWRVTVSNAVVLRPVYAVEIEFVGGVRFQWKGTVDQNGNVIEIGFTLAK